METKDLVDILSVVDPDLRLQNLVMTLWVSSMDNCVYLDLCANKLNKISTKSFKTYQEGVDKFLELCSYPYISVKILKELDLELDKDFTYWLEK